MRRRLLIVIIAIGGAVSGEASNLSSGHGSMKLQKAELEHLKLKTTVTNRFKNGAVGIGMRTMAEIIGRTRAKSIRKMEAERDKTLSKILETIDGMKRERCRREITGE
ncbi:hypothetical protein U8335_18685 [Roseiconus lacunae]|uniref:hypothetical protein n=1 Tax=Roseiconus lacunae TaxID=2605694 RepID=UPI00308A69E4|nr:hypothetical protein U8335_18685 [Stieleria sp. HD01]